MSDALPQDTDLSGIEVLSGGVMRANISMGQPAPQEAPKRPENIPEKFWDSEKGTVKADEMARSYAELERAFSQRQTPTPPKAPDAAPPPKTGEEPKPGDASPKEGTGEQAEAKQAVENAGLDFDKVSSEFAEKGELSPETYASLEKGGIPRAMVDNYVAGQQAVAQAFTNTVHEAAGGKDAHDAMIQWAVANFTPGERAAYNAVMANVRNPDGARMAVQGLAARYAQEMGTPPQVTVRGGSATGDVYESVAQVTADMRDPRYQKDSAYRARVESKLARSNVF